MMTASEETIIEDYCTDSENDATEIFLESMDIRSNAKVIPFVEKVIFIIFTYMMV